MMCCACISHMCVCVCVSFTTCIHTHAQHNVLQLRWRVEEPERDKDTRRQSKREREARAKKKSQSRNSEMSISWIKTCVWCSRECVHVMFFFWFYCLTNKIFMKVFCIYVWKNRVFHEWRKVFCHWNCTDYDLNKSVHFGKMVCI